MTITDLDAEAVRTDAFLQAWSDWHRGLEEFRALPHSFLAMTSFNLLDSTARRFPDAPGEWSTGSNGPVVDLADGESLEIDGEIVSGHHEFGVIGERTFRRVAFGDAIVELSKRGGLDILRPLHPEHPLRANYRGTPTFAPDPRWVVPARFEAFDTVRDTPIDAAIEAVHHVYGSPGRLHFEFEGAEYSLLLLEGHRPGTGTALFRDATSGISTYGASRTLAVELPAAGSTETLIDFNRTGNLQCAYTDFAPCPLAPAENQLPFAVEAGEKLPHERARL